MPYGLQIKNSSGNIIIDGQYKNYALWDSDTATLDAGVTTIAFTATTQMPLIALRPGTGKTVILWGLRKTGSNYDGFYVVGGNGDSLDWRVYTAHPAASAQNYGLRIYDGSSNLLFDSGYQYFNIYQLDTGISLSTPLLTEEAAGTYSDITHAGISDPFYFLSPLGFWCYGISSGSQLRAVWRSAIKKIDATSVRVKWAKKFQGPSGGADFDEGWNPNLTLMTLK